MTPEEKFNQLENYSEDNLRRISTFIKIVINHIELIGWHRLTMLIKIPLSTLTKDGISYEEAKIIIGGINKIYGNVLITIINEEPYKLLHDSDSGTMFPRLTDELLEAVRKRDLLREWVFTTGKFINIWEDDLKNNLILRLSNTEQEFSRILNNYQKILDGKIKEFEKKTPQKMKDNVVAVPIAIPIKNAQLDEQNYLLEINNGEKILSFKSKKQIKKLGEDLTREEREQLEKETLKTKQWKILYHLWDFRWELKNSKVIRKGDFVSLGNLAKASGSDSQDAVYKHIQRLNTKFQKERVAIKIVGENEKYRLIIYKA